MRKAIIWLLTSILLGCTERHVDLESMLGSARSELWAAQGTLGQARSNHTATLLLDGRVLVVGGLTASGPTTACEIYNPATGNWSATGSLTTARYDHAATRLLSDGRVLVAGGIGASNNLLSDAEVFHPGSGMWSGAGTMSVARALFTLNATYNGFNAIAYAAGGLAPGVFCPSQPCRQATNLVDIYDSVTGWSAGPSLSHARYAHSGVYEDWLTAKVVVMGGYGPASSVLDSVETTYQGATQWETATPMNAARAYFAAAITPVGSGYLVVSGGVNTAGTVLSGSERYYVDDDNAGWTQLGNMTGPRVAHQMVPLGNTIIATGGYNGSATPLATAEIATTTSTSLTWAPTTNMTGARYFHTANTLSDGTVVVAGGFNSSQLSSSELFVPDGKWTSKMSMGTARLLAAAAQLSNGTVLVTGGDVTPFTSSSATTSVETYNSASDQWASTTSMNVARYWHSITALPNGKALVVGGRNSSAMALASCEIYDATASPPSWTHRTPIPGGRVGHTAVLLASGLVLVFGGIDSSNQIPATSYLYNQATDSWTPTNGAMAQGRLWHGSILHSSGRVLAIGGYNTSVGYLSSVEEYNPSTGTWSTLTPLSDGRWNGMAVLELPSTRLLVVGGHDSSASLTATAEIYDRTGGGSTTPAASMSQVRGRMGSQRWGIYGLVFGGYASSIHSSAELYSEHHNAWYLTTSMGDFRDEPMSVALTNGGVLACGGYDSTGLHTSCELYE